MSTKEKAVRDAAVTLHAALVAAKAVGLVVVWPSSPDGLQSLAISETAKSNADATVTVVAKGVEPGSPEHAKVEQVAQKAVDAAVPDPKK